MHTVWFKLLCAAFVGVAFVPGPVWAQGGLSAAERQAAAEGAYDRGTRAYRAGRYDQAAGWYETAYGMAPAANALIQAIRARQRAGHTLRTGTLVLALGSIYGEARLKRYRSALADAKKEGYLVTVECAEPCTIALNGEEQHFLSLFLTPDTEHVITVAFESGGAEDVKVMGPAGEARTIEVAPPEPEPEPEPSAPAPSVAPAPPVGGAATDEDRRGMRVLSPAVFLVGVGVSLGAAGAAVWSWIDTKDAEDRYNAMPTLERYEDGRKREKRTSGLLGASLVVGTLSLTLGAFFTDFSGDEDEGADDGPSIGFGPVRGGGVVSVRGHLP